MVVDCHIHMALDGGYWKDALARHKEAPDEQFIRKTLETYKSLGFTYLRDGGDRWNAGKRASELAELLETDAFQAWFYRLGYENELEKMQEIKEHRP